MAAPATTRCAEGYMEYNNRCWKFVTDDKKNWNDAKYACNAESADLATISSQDEQNFINSQLPLCCSKHSHFNDWLVNMRFLVMLFFVKR